MKKLLLVFAVTFLTLSLNSCRETNNQESEEPVEAIDREVDSEVEEATEDIDEEAREAEAEMEGEVNENDDI